MDVRKRQPLGVELVKRGIVGEADISNALEYQRDYPNKKIGEILYLQNACEPTKLIEAIGDILGTKGILLTRNSIKIKITDYISIDIAKKNKVIPFEVSQGKIKVCFATTTNSRNMDSIRMLMLNKGLVMETYITFESDIDKIINSLEGSSVSNFNAPSGRNDTVTSLVDSIIKTGMERRASDIHIEPLTDKVRVRYRIDGELFTATEIDKEKQSQVIGRLKAISNMHQEIVYDQDGSINTYDGYSIRVSSQKNVNGEKFVLRLLKKNADKRSLFELGFMNNNELVDKAFNRKNSLIVIGAPTGEGKTTTLYSVIEYLNKPEINIISIENPVERRIPGINQVEIAPNITFASALRTVLRQDPDIILVGEIRDEETAKIAIEAGQTGHLVLSTIHTIDAVEVVTRIRKMQVSNYDVSATVATTISQRLVRRLCNKCKKEHVLTDEEKKYIEKVSKSTGVDFDLEHAKTYEPVGCKYCNDIGYYERVAMFEVLCIDDYLKDMISEGKSSIEIRDYAIKNTDYKPMVVDGINKVLQGITTVEEIKNKITI